MALTLLCSIQSAEAEPATTAPNSNIARLVNKRILAPYAWSTSEYYARNAAKTPCPWGIIAS